MSRSDEIIDKIHEANPLMVGAGGLSDLKEVPVHANSSVHFGASSSPDLVFITKVDDKRITYRMYPYLKDSRIEKNIGMDLISKGMNTWLNSGYVRYQPQRAKKYKDILAGKKPKKENLDDFIPADIKARIPEKVMLDKYKSDNKLWDHLERVLSLEVQGMMNKPDKDGNVEWLIFSTKGKAKDVMTTLKGAGFVSFDVEVRTDL